MSEQLIRQAVAGDSNVDTDTAAAIGKAALRMEEIANDMAAAKATDTARFDALQAEQVAQAEILTALKAKHDEEVRESTLQAASADAKAALAMAQGLRSPSKAALIGTGSGLLVPSMGGYVKGAFLRALTTFQDNSAFDDDRKAAKAALESMSVYLTPEEAGSKATLGTTDATGGWVIPNAAVEPTIKTGRYRSAVTGLVTSITGMGGVYSVDQPFRRSAPARMVVAPWGDVKENSNLTYEGYAATLYTIARIYDLAKQFVRKSAGAAEQDVIQELSHAFDLGAAYYILSGSGSAEPYGLQTALALGGAAGFTSSHTASDTTLAGSKARAIATAAGALASRNRVPEAAIMGSVAYWRMLSEGTDTAGFFFAPAEGPQGIAPGTLVTPFGVPVYPENSIAAADDLIVGEWSALKVYYGDGLRVDTSSEAGERWDRNLIGFRGEGEMGLDARPAVFAGAFELVADIVA